MKPVLVQQVNCSSSYPNKISLHSYPSYERLIACGVIVYIAHAALYQFGEERERERNYAYIRKMTKREEEEEGGEGVRGLSLLTRRVQAIIIIAGGRKVVHCTAHKPDSHHHLPITRLTWASWWRAEEEISRLLIAAYVARQRVHAPLMIPVCVCVCFMNSTILMWWRDAE